MTSSRIPMPTDAAEQHAWAAAFEKRYGMPPIAGGEAQPGEPPASGAATAEPPAEQAPPEGGQPATGEGGEEQRPEWAQRLEDQMDRVIAGIQPATPDPLAEQFGLVPPSSGPDDYGQAQPAYGQPQAPQAPPTQPPQPGMPGGDQLDPSEAQQIEQYLESKIEEGINQRVAPYIQNQEMQRRRDEAFTLLEDYPELKQPETAEKLVPAVREWAGDLGIPQLSALPGFVELVHLASKQLEQGRSETPATPGGQPEVQLESPGGANPGPAQPEQDEQQRIKDAGGGGLTAFWR